MTLGTWSAFILTIVALAAYWLLPVRMRTAVLILASYAFYTVAFPAYALLLAALTLATYFVGIRVRRDRDSADRILLAAGVTGALVVLGVFKYAAFIAGAVGSLATRFSLGFSVPVPAIVAPLGISFITFGLIHFLAEMRKGDAPEPGFWEYVSYVSFFPTVVSGPIKRYRDFVADARSVPARLAGSDWAYGLWRILLGLFRKFVIADTIGVLTEPLLKAQTGTPLLVLAVYAYAFKIYFDFAGYSDIAIGTARLFGYHIMENFNGPYLRRNISEFWRNWHASLTRFITDYIYIPLGGSRRGQLRVALNTLVAMGLSGLWHGPALHYIAWGLWHGVGLAVLRLWRQAAAALRVRFPWLDRTAESRVGRAASYGFGWFVTFNYVALGWVLFVLPVGKSLAVYRAFAGYVFEVIRRVVGFVL
ncbi:MAG: MBOAT family O-acyltransferase [Actinomycetota bacterium]|nr:MAG: membrane bound O-acyl transferase MBOAT family [Actinomycetota bacterium]MDP3631206.1 MBOAT family O-acyltransferase [Actinomycetota bacterium]